MRELLLDELLKLQRFGYQFVALGWRAEKIEKLAKLEAAKAKVQVDCFGLARG